MDYVLEKAEYFQTKALDTEILTVDNHADAAYLYLKLKEKNPQQAEHALELLKLNGGNSTGTGIGCVDFVGNVHPDQFWQHYSLGNIRERPFSEIWSDTSEQLLTCFARPEKASLWQMRRMPDSWTFAMATFGLGPKQFMAIYGHLTPHAT